MTVVYLVLIYGFLAYLGAQDHLINVEPRRRLLIIGVTRPGSPIGCVFLFLFFFLSARSSVVTFIDKDTNCYIVVVPSSRWLGVSWLVS